MARQRMVTRTVEVTKVTFMTLNVLTAKVENVTKELTGKVDKESALKFAQKKFQSETVKYAAVVSLETEEQLYGMLETEFIKHAKKMDSRFETI